MNQPREAPLRPTVAVIGGGPAGLAAAEVLAPAADVHVFDAMPSFGRKFLLAGKSGLNITHAEPAEPFLERFAVARAFLEPALRAFSPDAIRNWALDLGIETFVGSSGRVFPTMLKTSPLLRAWLARLREAGVTFHVRQRWTGWEPSGALTFDGPEGVHIVQAAATVLAMGGGSWPRLGSTGAWLPLLEQRGVSCRALRPANCGFDVDWSAHFRERFAGSPVKSVRLTSGGLHVQGDFVASASGIEGSAVYAVAAPLRDEIDARGRAVLTVDLAPDRSRERLAQALARPRGKTSVSNHVRKATGLPPVKLALLREVVGAATLADPARLAAAIKSLPVEITRTRPLAEAISSAGGVALAEVDSSYMLRKLPGVFVAGEMLDWEAPTGGYLLTACLATGRAAGRGVVEWARSATAVTSPESADTP